MCSRVSSLRGYGAAVYLLLSAAKVLVFIKDCLARGLRRIVHRSVACWIRSLFSRLRSSRCWEDLLPRVLAVKDRATPRRISWVPPYQLISNSSVIHEMFLQPTAESRHLFTYNPVVRLPWVLGEYKILVYIDIRSHQGGTL